MFNKADIERAVNIQKLAYKFLMYIANKIDNGEFTFSRIHQAETSSAVVAAWLKIYYDYLPQSILPDRAEIQAFSNYFVSYLSTSFELTEEPEISPSKCYCDICLQMLNLSHLKPISPNNYDREIAAEKRFDMVKALGAYYGLALTDAKYETLANDNLYTKDIGYLAYTKSLFQRIESSIGGIYIVALWRQFAWSKGQPIRDFELKTDDILTAMQRVKVALFSLEDD